MWNGYLTLGLGLLAAILFAAVLHARANLGRLRRRATQAERLAAARGRSLGLAAQELRGPALSLLSHADRLAGNRATADQAIALDGMGQDLLRLADDLADFAADPTPRTLREAEVMLGPVVDAAVAMVAAQIRPGRRHWQVEPALRGLVVRADPRALEGALGAVLRRAARQSRDGDVVAIRHVVAAETVAIVVEDEGDGLPAHDLGTVPPAEAHAIERGPGTRGVDLGLALARSLAAAHGGDLKLETAPGIGARAWLTLPRERLLQPA
jgi:signal transduction histidine kinase